jgi:hypothetical protein
MLHGEDLAILPSHQPHKNLEIEVGEFLESRGFYLSSSTYHDVMPDEISERLSRIYTPTSLYVRGRADKLAIHKTKNLVFEWEAKTHGGSPFHNMALEVMPFIHHLTRAQHHVKCLYCYRDPEMGYECGFWIHDHPQIKAIKLPRRWNGGLRRWFIEQFELFLPHVPVNDCKGTGGSDDPFLVIHEYYAKHLPDWRDLVVK